MILENISLTWILLPFMLAAIVYTRIRRSRTGDKLRDSLHSLQVTATMMMIAFLVMWILLPQAPVLSSFGYPETVEDINSPEKMLKLMQQYNKAVVRTTEAVYWMVFLLAFWFMGTLIGVLGAAKSKIDDNHNPPDGQ